MSLAQTAAKAAVKGRIVSPFTPELPRASMPGAGPFRATVLL